jgi:tetratricopeptide (TPR) repeat protein
MWSRLSLLLAAVIPIALTPALSAQERAHPTADKLGTVHFQTSCATSVAPGFDRGVALLHSFEFAASMREFQAVITADSTCAMAWWGIALARWSNPMAPNIRPPAAIAAGMEAVDAARRASSRATPRERDYIEAVAQLYSDAGTRNQQERLAGYEAAMAQVAARNPADTEARIFHALALVQSASPSDKTYAKQRQAGAILEGLFRSQPDHPGLAHYIIHAYDVPALADQAIGAAERYSAIAPAAAHALHMPSHTFTQVGMWKESVHANLLSMDAAIAQGSLAEALHAADYAVYADLQLGQDTAALAIVQRLPEIAERFDPKAITGAAPGSAGVFALAAIPARYAVERGAWKHAAALPVARSDYPFADAVTWFARALGAARAGDTIAVGIATDTLSALQKRLADAGEAYWAEQVAIQHLGASAWRDFAAGRTQQALARMRQAVEREVATEKSAISPGPLAPAQELLGDMLLELGRRDEAVAEYRASLQREPGRRRSEEGIKRAATAGESESNGFM